MTSKKRKNSLLAKKNSFIESGPGEIAQNTGTGTLLLVDKSQNLNSI